ncbi:IPIL1 protein, partial [Turnix velox]|nr:IPIL1 protein [Turnix velox]
EENDGEREEVDEEEEKEEKEEEEAISLVRKCSHMAVQEVASRAQMVEDLVDELLNVFVSRISKSFFPVPQPAIGVGSSFEGWSPKGQDSDFHLLVPLKPPRGFLFHVEAGAGRDTAAKAHILMELEGTCSRDQEQRRGLFLHRLCHGVLRRGEANHLCPEGSLNVEKVARWFQCGVKSAWKKTPLASSYTMEVLPSRCSCGLKLTDSCRTTFSIQLLFGVQRGDSHVFLSSQVSEAIFTPSTTWVESFTVAEKNFFSHMARQVPQDSFHLECLYFCASCLEGTSISHYALKTVVMHLNFIPITHWRRRQFLSRVQDVMCYLYTCLEEKSLNHFICGNKEMPQNIILPPDVQEPQKQNLFQHLEQDPAAHAKALEEFRDL